MNQINIKLSSNTREALVTIYAIDDEAEPKAGSEIERPIDNIQPTFANRAQPLLATNNTIKSDKMSFPRMVPFIKAGLQEDDGYQFQDFQHRAESSTSNTFVTYTVQKPVRVFELDSNPINVATEVR